LASDSLQNKAILGFPLGPAFESRLGVPGRRKSLHDDWKAGRPGWAVAGVPEFKNLNRAVKAANLPVPIAAAYPLAEAAKAHERLVQGHVLGKIVLRIHA